MLPRFIVIAVVSLSALAGIRESVCAGNRKPTEQEVKAAYIYNFAKFVEWPPTGSPGGGATLDLCVTGDGTMTSALAAIEGKSVGMRKIRIKPDQPLQGLRGCDILFIGAMEKRELKQILAAVNDRALLTIADTKGFARQGVMINFYTENNRVLFEINPKAATGARLRISSALLGIARIVAEP